VIYFNDNEKYVVQWLRNLYPDSVVDGRGVEELTADDVANYTRAHFFAGIGGWEYALTLAGWPETSPVWTASLPCQPFSTAGKRLGEQDERHLWPVFRNLVEQCLPPVIFGEQVASKDGRLWLSGVRADLEALGYAVGAADLCAAGIGAPHIRQRLYWVANANLESGQRRTGSLLRTQTAVSGTREQDGYQPNGLGDGGEANRLDYAPSIRLREQRPGQAVQMEGECTQRAGQYAQSVRAGQLSSGLEGRSSAGYWDEFDVANLRDGTYRRVEPSSFPLAHGIPNRVGRIRAYGGAIVPQLAAEFIGAYLAT
jgi:DNA (cytosine-5)-methyltransferase 1